jgi:hypothetical protein
MTGDEGFLVGHFRLDLWAVVGLLGQALFSMRFLIQWIMSERARRFALFFGFWVLTKQLIFVQLIVPTMSDKPEMAIWLEPLLALTVLGVPGIYALLDLRATRQLKAAYAP